MSSILEVKKRVGDVLLESEDITAIGVTPDRSRLVIYTRDPNLEFDFYSIAGYPVKVVPLGTISIAEFQDQKTKIRPIIGGISTGYKLQNTGTLGGIVYDNDTGEPYLISNNHVFGNKSTESHPNVRVGDDIIQPGVVDGGNGSDVVGNLADFIPWAENDKLNISDVAIATPTVDFLNGILKDGHPVTPSGVAPLYRKERVWKVGRSSGYTEGSVLDLDFTVDVVAGKNPDGTNKYVRFADQILLDLNAAPGDSGALVMDFNNHVVGLLFAGGQMFDGNYFVVANKIRNVLSMINCSIPVSVQETSAQSAGSVVAIGIYAAMSAALIYGIMKSTKRPG